ncbi:MAG: calcium-binding protein, partial [Phenylobacterium sp.]|nr:calcium-binding protein [Phenylobacterium sp.]
MATYFFETITAEQALGITPTTQLIFTTAGATASAVTTTINAATATSPQTVSMTFGGRTVVFGEGILNNQVITFSDASKLYVGDAANNTATGVDGRDVLFGGEGNDSLVGGSNADYLHGNQGIDSLAGDAGADTLLGGQGDDTIGDS